MLAGTISPDALMIMATTKPNTLSTPTAEGFRMPAEWEPHAATWLGWPHEPTDWPGKMEPIRWVYGEIIRKVGAGERIRLCVNSPADARRAKEIIPAAGGDLKQVDFLPFPTNRGIHC